ncbi:MAG TPA: hypothetical protein VGM88_29170 [Kofleriaceae bacterium]|jgi:hypothetical protein
MRVGAAALLLAIGLIACGDDGSHRLADAPSGSGGDGGPTATLVIAPDDVTLTVDNQVAATQAYTAMLMKDDGTMTDVTSSTVFTLADSGYGSFTGAMATLTGAGAGVTHVVGTYNLNEAPITGMAKLTVLVHETVVATGVDPGSPGNFDSATEDPTLAPGIVYPSDGILVPPNLGQFDVHWHNSASGTPNVFQVELSNQYVDVKLYTTGISATPTGQETPYWTLFAPSQWYPIASTKTQLTLSVAGMNTADVTHKGTSGTQHVDVTNENAQGGIYYWTSSGEAGVWRYDVSTPDVPPTPFFPDASRPSSCMGCHTLSRDGTKIAITLDGGGGRGSLWDVGTMTQIPSTVGTIYWDFAGFNPTADKVVTVENGTMRLRNVADTTQIGTDLPTYNTSALSTHPEISPDGTIMANSEYTGGGVDYDCYDGYIVTRSYDDTTGTFGGPAILVDMDPTNAIYNWYPSFSPDSQWIAFTRNSQVSYNDPTAETWIVKADGSLPPIKMQTADTDGANITNSWPRWVPFGQTFGATDEPLFYLTFSSVRPFGVRIPGGGQPQIWMTPFFPNRALEGMDPSGPAFRVPFQDVTTNNHIAQWTQQVVIGRDANGKIITQKDAVAAKKAAAAAAAH